MVEGSVGRQLQIGVLVCQPDQNQCFWASAGGCHCRLGCLVVGVAVSKTGETQGCETLTSIWTLEVEGGANLAQVDWWCGWST
jgi:hypothetical protein